MCDLQHTMSVSILHRVINNLVLLRFLLILGMLKMEYIESRGAACLWLRRRYLPFTRKLIQHSKIDRLVSIVIITTAVSRHQNALILYSCKIRLGVTTTSILKRLLIGGWISYRSIHFLDNLLLFVSVQKSLTRFELLAELLNFFFH